MPQNEFNPMKTLYLDCFCGISGDMTVGALIDAGVEPAYLQTVASSLNLDGVKILADKVEKHGIQATQFQVVIDPDTVQPHRHLKHIIAIIQQADVTDLAKESSIAVFEKIAQAEASVHGLPVEKIHFHEVGALDSIMDIVLSNAALYSLGIERVLCSPLVTGTGTVACDHGVMPVPAPATALLLRDIPWSAGDIPCEQVTPTGAALAVAWADAFESMPSMTVHTIGYGAGSRDLPDRSNVLRVFIGESADKMPDTETIAVLETTVDDMNPELMALLTPALLHDGARDVLVAPVSVKKGRTAQHVTVLTDPGKAWQMAKIIFTYTTTLGVRVHEERRWVLKRELRHVATPWGRVTVKVGFWEDKETAVSPEFEECRTLAESWDTTARAVYEAALAAAIKGEYLHE